MSRIKIKDLPLDKKIRKEDMKNIKGGVLLQVQSPIIIDSTAYTDTLNNIMKKDSDSTSTIVQNTK